MSDGWIRVTKTKPCAICKKPDWCTLSADGAVACCMRVESKHQMKNSGYLHRITEAPKARPRSEVQRPPKPQPAPPDWNAMLPVFSELVDPDALTALAQSLGLTMESLDQLDIGWRGDCWTFPMYDSKRNCVGVRTRFPDGQKRSIPGTHQGLFIPRNRKEGPLLFTEGPTDCAALRDLGFDSIGRPSCYGCEEWCSELARGRAVGIIADNDDAGNRGANRLAQAIRKSVYSVKVIHPPYTKDARAWKLAGATRESIVARLTAIREFHPLLKGKP